MSGRVEEGGCQCGAVRIRVREEPTTVVYCHCRDCRKANGAPVSLFVGYLAEQIETQRGTPRSYESSPGVRRSFCGECGSPLSYEDERLPGEIHIPVGVFDDPEVFEPGAHSWASQQLSWFELGDDLHRHPRSSRPR